MKASTSTSVSLDQLVLQAKPGVTWSLHESGGRPYYLVEDTVQSRFFRMGLREFSLLEQLDGVRSLGKISAGLAASGMESPLSELEIKALCQWLMQAGLISSPQLAQSAGTRQPKSSGWLHQLATNPLFIKVPLVNPDRALAAILPAFRWTLTKTAFCVWLAVVVWAACSLLVQAEEFQSKLTTVFAPQNWLMLLAGWLGLKIIHELYHGLVCKLYGGTVPQAGLMFIMFSPVAFVDVTSSWRFRSKWQRINTAAAGMYSEFFVAAVAALAWCRLEDGWSRQICHNLVTMASVTTLVFNGNFLMRFDGYYIVGDLLEIQNLYASARQCIINRIRNFFWGLHGAVPEHEGWRRYVVHAYGWASLVWRILFAVGILIVSARMFGGLGLILTLITGISWFAVPWSRAVWGLVNRPPGQRPHWGRFICVNGGLAAGLAGIACLPWPGGVRAPAVVDYAPLHVVRVVAPGFIEQVCVEAGQTVAPGDVLVVLRDPDILQRLQDLELEIAQSEVRSRILHREDRMSDYLVENRNRQALEERLAQLQTEVAQLTIRATCHGNVLGRDLPSLVGQYAEMGKELMAVGDEHHKHLEASIAQQDIDYFRASLGTQNLFCLKGSGRVEHGVALTRVNPRASTQVRHPALLATSGGPLAVAWRTAEPASAASGQTTSELTEPRFTAIFELPEERAESLRAGQLAYVKLGQHQRSIGRHVLDVVGHWIDRKSTQRGDG